MARVLVLSTPGCAGCARAKELVAEVLSAFPGLDWEEVDLTEQPEVAARYGVMSVPAVVIDGRLEFAKLPTGDELRRRLETLVESVSQLSVVRVHGMTCAGCEKNIDFALSALAGVERVQADYRTGNVTIAYDPDLTSMERVRKALEDIGYDVIG